MRRFAVDRRDVPLLRARSLIGGTMDYC